MSAVHLVCFVTAFTQGNAASHAIVSQPRTSAESLRSVPPSFVFRVYSTSTSRGLYATFSPPVDSPRREKVPNALAPESRKVPRKWARNPLPIHALWSSRSIPVPPACRL